MEKLSVLLPPFVICVILTGIHGYLGIHVLARRVIFVDLAMAQIAALGTTFAFVYGNDPYSPTSYFVSLGFTVLGAAVFALTRTRRERVPQEATIGLVYAIATAAAILLADRAAHGTEHLKNLLAGSIVWVTWPQILKTFLIYAALGTFHFVCRERFLAISNDPEGAAARGWNLRLWDFFFYATFGVIITSSVQIAGILLVFCYLIAPAVFAVQFADTLGGRLAIGWSVGVLASAVGLNYSYEADLPSGPAIIVVFAALLALSAMLRVVKSSSRPGRTTALMLAGIAAVYGGHRALVHFVQTQDEHSHGEPEHAVGNTVEDLLHALADEHANVRAAACEKLGIMGAKEAVAPLRRLLLEDPADSVKEKAAVALGALGAKEAIPELRQEAQKESEDEWVQFHAAEALAWLGDSECYATLFRLAFAAKTPALREEASGFVLRISDLAEAGPQRVASSERLPLLQRIQHSWKNAGKSICWDPGARKFLLPKLDDSPQSPR